MSTPTPIPIVFIEGMLCACCVSEKEKGVCISMSAEGCVFAPKWREGGPQSAQQHTVPMLLQHGRVQLAQVTDGAGDGVWHDTRMGEGVCL